VVEISMIFMRINLPQFKRAGCAVGLQYAVEKYW